VYRPRNTRYDEQYIQKTERSGRFSVNMWAWISAVSPGVMLHVEPRLNADVYIRILEDVMLRSVRRAFPNGDFIFQQDNCPIHTGGRRCSLTTRDHAAASGAPAQTAPWCHRIYGRSYQTL
jgi:hypothetical protein